MEGVTVFNRPSSRYIFRPPFIAHRARRSNIGPTHRQEKPEPNNLLCFLMEIAPRAKSLLLATATPVQLDPIEAWDLLRSLHWQNHDMPAYQNATLRCCKLNMHAHNDDAAWSDYQDYMNSGGLDLPLSLRFDLCRILENQGNLEMAVSEYEKLAANNPGERQALMAQLAAAKLCLKKLNRPHDALKFFKMADASPVPHLDFDQTIQSGIHEVKIALSAANNPKARQPLLESNQQNPH